MSKKTDYVVLESGNTEKQYWKDLWDFRELFFFLAWRDFIVRYKQTVLGVVWSFARPIFTMVVMTVVFGNLAKLPSDGAPYAVLVFAALLPWQFFTTSLTTSTNSVISSKALISKVYFPRLLLPPSSIMVNLVDFLIAFIIMICLLVWYGIMPGLRILTIPLFLCIAIMASLGAGLWMSALNVRFRDIQNIVPIIIQLGTYISPVAYSASVIPEKYRLIYSLNPMVGAIDGFRWAIIGGDFQIYMPGLALSILLTSLVFISGVWYFRKTEQIFADVI